MPAIQIELTKAEVAEVDRLVHFEHDSKNRADLVRKATIEYCLRRRLAKSELCSIVPESAGEPILESG